jgi:uncharacterized protein (TIGR03437 family)
MKFHQPFLFKAATVGVLLSFSVGQIRAQSVYVTTTVAGNGSLGFSGDGAAATLAQLDSPVGLALDSAHTLYIADELNFRIRQVVAATQVIQSPVGNGTAGYAGDGAKGTSAELNSPLGVTVDPSGNFYIADSVNNVIRKVTPSDEISTVAGDNALGAGFSGDGGAPLNAQLNGPSAVALDAAGNLYIADTGNDLVRKVSFSANTIMTIAGTGGTSFSGDGLPAVDASLHAPRGLAFDAAGNLYIADSGNHAIRKVNATTQIISTVAGNGTLGFIDNVAATSAQLNYPLGVTFDSAGSMYIADSQNFRIRKVTNGIMTTIAGTGEPGYGGDGLYSTSSLFNFPASVVVDSSGNVYVGDSGNNVVRKLTPYAAPLAPPAINNGGVVSASSFGQFGLVAPGSWIEIYGANLAIGSRTWAASDFQGINAPTSLNGTSVTIGGHNAYVEFIGSQQVNVQVPTGIATGPQEIVVYTGAGQSLPQTIGVEPLQPGLFAPASSNLGGLQYVWAQLPDGSVVLPSGAASSTPSRPAKVGEIMVMYGVGFGPVTPAIPAGQIVQQSNTLAENFRIEFGGVPAATVNYAGLAPGAVGLYQFNVVVPNVGAGNAIPLTFTVANYPSQQTLYTAVQ